LSVPSNSILRRILDEVTAGAMPSGCAQAEIGEAPGQRLEVWRATDVHRPPFATSLHFWAHALRAFLGAHHRPDAFLPLASHCLCEAVPKDEIARAFDRLARRVGPRFDVARNTGYRAGYRMIEQDEFASWVAERDGEFVALFWLRPGWLALARALPVEPIEFIEPEFVEL